MDSERQRIQVELELDGTSPTGRATLCGGETRTFSGWIGLVAAVDQLVAHDARELRSDDRGGAEGLPRLS